MRLRALFLVFAVALGTAGCSLQGTGGELVPASMRAETVSAPGDGSPMEMELASGWKVRLTEAKILLGPVYVYAPRQVALVDRVEALFVSHARAHAGDDTEFAAKVLTELLDQQVVDLLAGPVELGAVIAESGRADRLTIVLDEARGDFADPSGPTRGYHAYLGGTASRILEDGTEISFDFEAGIDLPEDRLARRVDDVPFANNDVIVEGSVINVVLQPSEWLRRVDFEALYAAHQGEAKFTVEAPSQLHNAWYLGLRDGAAWGADIMSPLP